MAAPQIVEGEGFRLGFENRPGYLRAQVDGARDSLEISIGYWTAVARVCRERGTRCLLVAERLGEFDGSDAEADVEILANVLVELGFRNIRIAFVDLREKPLRASQYGEILARERGVLVRVFTREDEAALWLRHGET